MQLNAKSKAIKDFLALTDTPGSFSGQSRKVVAVNVGETALEFIAPWSSDHSALSNLTWSTAGHTIDADVDFAGFDLTNVTDISLSSITSVGYLDYKATTAHRFNMVAADTDVRLEFVGTTNSGLLIWLEDEDAFYFNDSVLMLGSKALTFRDANAYIYSSSSGVLDIFASGSHRLTTAVNTDLDLNFIGTTNSGVLTWMEDEDYFLFGDDIMLADGENIILDSTTGTKIGTGTTQKLGFFNATPVVQQPTIADADGTLADITTKFNTLLAQLEALGLNASV